RCPHPEERANGPRLEGARACVLRDARKGALLRTRRIVHPVCTGPPAFFQASMPPAMWAVLARPASLAAATAMAERSPNAQKNTMRRPVAAATSRNMPPGCRLRSEEHTSELQSTDHHVCRLPLA